MKFDTPKKCAEEYGMTPNVRHLENPKRDAINILLTSPNWFNLPNDLMSGKQLAEFSETNPNIEIVDWFGDPDEHNKKGQKHDGSASYVISTISTDIKFSSGYSVCTAIVLTAQDENDKPISLLTHQVPSDTIDSSSFETDIRKTIRNFIKKSKAGTIDAIIAGGYFGKNLDTPEDKNDYVRVIELLGRILTEEFEKLDNHAFSPKVAIGASDDSGINILLDTPNKNVYISKTSSDIDHDTNRDISFQWFDVANFAEDWYKNLGDEKEFLYNAMYTD